MDEGAQDTGVSVGSAPVPVAPRPRPGWYPDPWVGGQHRYWTGQAWTGDVFPSGPDAGGAGWNSWAGAAPARRPSETPPQATMDAPPPPPDWSPAAARLEPLGPEPTHATVSPPWRPSFRQLLAIAAVGGLLVGLLSGYLLSRGHAKAQAAPPVTLAPPVLAVPPGLTVPPVLTVPPGLTLPPAGTLPPGATLPPNSVPGGLATPGGTAAPSVLSGVVVQQSDVASNVTVGPLVGGGQVAGETTLDLCNGTFPSESLRTDRLQVGAVDDQGNELLSTEAVLYSTSAATAQAFAELQAVAAKCPSTPVTSPVGEPTVTTHFNAAPDAPWPQTATVQRLAFDFNTTDSLGQTQHSVAVYLRRGRALLGVYFSQADGPQTVITGQSTIAGIVNLFANRLAQLPASVVNG
jgi:Protein of unknown function (DUF2510)